MRTGESSLSQLRRRRAGCKRINWPRSFYLLSVSCKKPSTMNSRQAYAGNKMGSMKFNLYSIKFVIYSGLITDRHLLKFAMNITNSRGYPYYLSLVCFNLIYIYIIHLVIYYLLTKYIRVFQVTVM